MTVLLAWKLGWFPAMKMSGMVRSTRGSVSSSPEVKRAGGLVGARWPHSRHFSMATRGL